MEITEKERLMLVGKIELICRLTLGILDMAHDPQNNSLKIKKNIASILSVLNTIASFSDSKNYQLDALAEYADGLFKILTKRPEPLSEVDKEITDQLYPKLERLVIDEIERFCIYVNSIRFDFTNKGLKIGLPKLPKIKNLNLGVNINV
jgi:hypothetical protein